jgi:hypothetical protein
VLALVAAVAMVMGAFAVRDGAFDDDGVASGGPPGSGADVLRLHCATELADVCRRLAGADDRFEVRDERPGLTVDALLAGTELPADVWLAPRPWVEQVRQLGRGALLGEPTGVLARSPLVLVAFDVADTGCADEPVGWRCIGEAPDARPGIQQRADTAGLFTLAQAGAGYLGRAGYATNDFEVEPEGGGPPLVDRVSALLRAVPRGSSFATPLDAMLATGAATFDFAATIEAVATSAIAGTRQEGALRLIYAEPMATVDVVAVTLSSGGDGGAAELLELLRGDRGADAFAAAGWRVEGRPPPPGADPAVVLGPDDGLPEAGVLAALRSRFP